MTSTAETATQPAAATPPRKGRPARRFNVNRMTMLGLVAPSVVLLLLVNAYPFIDAAIE
jgi:hypothetical protein